MSRLVLVVRMNYGHGQSVNIILIRHFHKFLKNCDIWYRTASTIPHRRRWGIGHPSKLLRRWNFYENEIWNKENYDWIGYRANISPQDYLNLLNKRYLEMSGIIYQVFETDEILSTDQLPLLLKSMAVKRARKSKSKSFFSPLNWLLKLVIYIVTKLYPMIKNSYATY